MELIKLLTHRLPRRAKLSSIAIPRSQITIGVPVFNGSDTVLNAVETALSQSGVDHRVLVSDNGSTDGTASLILDKFGERPRLHVVRHPTNQGATWNYNWLLHAANSEYFMWLAADDQLLPHYASRCIQKLVDEPGTSLAFGRVEMTRNANEAPFIIYEASRAYAGRPLRVFCDVYRGFPDVYMYGVMRTHMARVAGGLPNTPAADIAFIRRLSLQGSFVNVPDASYRYFTGVEWKDGDRIVSDEGPREIEARANTFRGRRSAILMLDAMKAVDQASVSQWERVIMWIIVIISEVERVLRRIAIDFLGRTLPASLRVQTARSIHDRWLAKERPRVQSAGTYLSRVVLPALRWR